MNIRNFVKTRAAAAAAAQHTTIARNDHHNVVVACARRRTNNSAYSNGIVPLAFRALRLARMERHQCACGFNSPQQHSTHGRKRLDSLVRFLTRANAVLSKMYNSLSHGKELRATRRRVRKLSLCLPELFIGKRQLCVALLQFSFIALGGAMYVEIIMRWFYMRGAKA